MEMNLNMTCLTPTAASFIKLSYFTCKHNYTGLAIPCCGTHLTSRSASKDSQLANKEVFLHTDATLCRMLCP